MTLCSTLSWFTATDTVTNTVFHDLEPDPGPFSVTAVDEFDPGNEVKRVGARNTGVKPAFVRVLLLPSLLLETPDGVSSLLPVSFGDDPGSDLLIINDFNLATWDGAAWTVGDWADGGDGYFYYLHLLAPGDSTDDLNQNLFNTVSVNAAALPPEYAGAVPRLEVLAEGVGAEPDAWRAAWWGGVTPATQPLSHIDTQLHDLLP
jgi:hypothetical protein